MATDVELLPLDNYAVYQLILKETNGNVSEFANRIGIAQQRINRLFSVDTRSGKYPRVSDSIMEAICDFYGICRDDLIKPYIYKYRNSEVVDPMKEMLEKKERKIVGFETNEYQSVSEEGANFTVGEPSFNYGKGKPFYDVPFKMGYELPFNDDASAPVCLIDFKPYNKCDFWCRATGDSMYPTIEDGDIIAVKRVYDFANMIVNRDIYAIVLKNDLRAVKRLIDKGDSFVLVSDNKEYEEQVISKSDVLYVYRVMGSLKMKMF